MIVIKHRRCRDVVLLQVKARRLHGHDFSGAFLVQAALSGASCVGARFPGANLREADLREADLRDTILCGATLRGADLNGADLRGADLRGANLEGANLAGVIHDRHTRWPEGWVPEPSAAHRRRRDSAVALVWREWAALPAIRQRVIARSGAGPANRPGAPWISALVLAGGVAVAATAVLKQQTAAPRHEMARIPAIIRAPRPSRAVDARPLPPARQAARPATARQAEISVPEPPRPRRAVLARHQPHPLWREAAGVPRHRLSRRAVRVARRDGAPTPVAGSGAAVQREPLTSTRPLVAHVPPRAARRVFLTEYTPGEPGASAELSGRGADRKAGKKRLDEPTRPRLAEAWGNPGFHYGSGYDIYEMHLR